MSYRKLLVLLAALATTLIQPAAMAAVPEVPKVMIGQDFPDPDILRVGNTWYAYATNNSWHVPVASAPTIDGPWSIRGDAMPHGWSDGWSVYGYTWAPDVVANPDGTFTLTYTARHGTTGRQCLGVALANSPLGPFVPYGGQPLVCSGSNVIDANTFVAADGTRYLLWKDGSHALYMQQAVDNGARLIGSRVTMLTSSGTVIEAPDIVQRGGRFFLFYSVNTFDSCNYHTAYATASSVTGPWQFTGTLMTQGNSGVCGPGGADVVTAADGLTGGDKMFVHGWLGGVRQLFSVDISWVNGLPVLGGHRAASLDGDGRAEIAAVQASGRVDAWHNDRGFSTRPYGDSVQIADGFTEPRRVRFADLNDDGRKEIIQIRPDGEVHAWLNWGGFRENPFGNSELIGTGFTDPERVRFADLDDDGRAELILVTGNATGDVIAWHNDGAFARMPYGAAATIADGFHDPARTSFADIDGDGRDEIAAVQTSGEIRTWHNDRGFATRPFGNSVIVADGFTDPTRVQFTDLDHDGRDELAVVQTSGEIWAWHNDRSFATRPFGNSVIVADGFTDPARAFFI
ncbi:family 43 glycosylhydrolase [Jiangella muralis]|uniref:family 43 glycosylhydrolase n=1 Tax=Jiangella muralis TaxID=702383 RepID=UPI00069D6DED|nr:family 43 glycosylhydrolase [Jiangella muralis]